MDGVYYMLMVDTYWSATASLKQDRKINQLTNLDKRRIKKWDEKGFSQKKNLGGVKDAVTVGIR